MDQPTIDPDGEDVFDLIPTTRYVLQFPYLPETTVIVIADFLREGFVDTYAEYIISSSVNNNIAPPEGIPDVCLIACNPESDDTCAICLEEANDSEERGWISLSTCNHRFHRHCITQVHGKKCPLCRTLQLAVV